MAAKKGLGKGLGGKGLSAIIPENPETENVGNGIKEVDINKVEPCRDQPRKVFNEDKLQELSESIKKHGIIDPLIVQDKGDYFEIVGGERRWRASKMAGLEKVPVIIGEYSEQQKVEIALIDNIQREDLNAIEEANTYKKLMDDFGMTQDQVAEAVSKSRPAIANALRLLKLSDKVQQMILDDVGLSSGHARTLLGLEDTTLQDELADRIIDERLSVREVEKEVKRLKSDKAENKDKNKTVIDEKLLAIYSDLEEQMKTVVGTKVSIIPKNNQKGKLEIEYYTQDDLDRIVDMIKNIQE